MTPQNKKIATYSAVALGLGLVVYYAFFNKDNDGAATDPTGNNGGNNPGLPTPVFNAKKVSLELFDAMNQIGTDEDAIISNLRTVTPAQFIQVIKAFGKERYTDYLGYKTSFGKERDLPYWLKAELSDQEYLNLKRKYPNSL
jgi:hypothetical protein